MKIKPNPDLQKLAIQRWEWTNAKDERETRLAAEKEQRRKARNRRKAGKL